LGAKIERYLTVVSFQEINLVTALVALALIVGCVSPTLAVEHKTKASCEKAHTNWDAFTKTCS
jgi:hypothetical protein